jgi:hypothetical protein
VYAFTSYPEIVARFLSGRADSALDQIRRTYGWMDRHDPGITDWEGIGPGGSLYEGAYTSMAHGWSTGVLPALTHQLLGASPLSPGYATWEVRPHPGDVAWAQGELPTPHGGLGVEWARTGGEFSLTVRVPARTRGSVALPTGGRNVVVRAGGRLLWDGKRGQVKGVSGGDGWVTVPDVGPGKHTFTVSPRRK